jgi:Domain of unknown function (DUF4402)
MIVKSIAFAVAALTVSVAAPALAQSASTTGTGSITVIRPLTLTKNADLRFGTVVRPSSGAGTAVVSAAGARSVTGGVVGLSSGDTPQAAQFTVDGEGGQSISVTIPATFSIANGTDTLTVTTSNNLSGSAASQTLSNALGSAGSLSFRVGGSVPVASTTATGAYTGTFTVSAAYN